jgi:hypothetical protein
MINADKEVFIVPGNPYRRCTTLIDFLANIRQALIVSLKSNAYTVFTELLVMKRLCIFSFASLMVNANMEVFVFS